ncbi:MAG: guanylate kinase, partial [Bryobacteraceae bacterium]
LKRKIPEAVSVFIVAPSREELERRLRGRSEDSQEAIRRRLGEAAREMSAYREYDYVVVNDQAGEAARRLAAIIEAERLRRSRMVPVVEAILAQFQG